MKASKLVHNSCNYISVCGNAQIGVLVNNLPDFKYFFGLEEWNNNDILKKEKIAYIDSFRVFNRPNLISRLFLFTYDITDKNIYLIGYLTNAKQLQNRDIEGIRESLIIQNWLQILQLDFNNIGDFRQIQNHHEYLNCWNSNNIVAETGKGFIVNIKYEKIQLFEIHERINLSEIYPEINLKWKRLSRLYNTFEDMEELLNNFI